MNDLNARFEFEKELSQQQKATAGGSFILDIPKLPPAIWGRDDEVAWMGGESLMIASMMGLGKTTLAGLLMRARLGLRDEVLGYPVKPCEGKILYLAMDRPEQARRSLTRQFGEHDRKLLDERLIVWPGPLPADVVRQPKTLLWLAEHFGASDVFADSVKDMAIGLSDEAVGAAYNRARQFVVSNGIQLCEQHHTVKRNAYGGQPSSAADIYGSAWITAGTGSILLLTGEPGDPVVDCKHVRQPVSEVGPWVLKHDEPTGELTIMPVDELDPLALLKEAGPDGLTARQLAEALYDSKKRADIEKARRQLVKLVAKDLAHCVPSGGIKQPTDVWFAGPGPAVTL